MMEQRPITDDLQALLDVLPKHITEAVVAANNFDNLLEIVLDLGRRPFARFVDGESSLSEKEITHEDIDTVVARIGDFDADNRAGMERTLHVSPLFAAARHIVGLTAGGACGLRHIDIIPDLVESGKSLLIS